MNDAEEVNAFGEHESVVWFFDNVSWGHLDQVPEKVLDDCLRDYDICGKATHVVLAGNFGEFGDSEDPYKLQGWCNRIRPLDRLPFITFRKWIFIERGRRMGVFKSQIPDVLVKEMVRPGIYQNFFIIHEPVMNELRRTVSQKLNFNHGDLKE